MNSKLTTPPLCVCVCVCGGALLAVRPNQTHPHAGLRGGCCRFEVHGRTSDRAQEAVGRPYVVVARCGLNV